MTRVWKVCLLVAGVVFFVAGHNSPAFAQRDSTIQSAAELIREIPNEFRPVLFATLAERAAERGQNELARDLVEEALSPETAQVDYFDAAGIFHLCVRMARITQHIEVNRPRLAQCLDRIESNSSAASLPLLLRLHDTLPQAVFEPERARIVEMLWRVAWPASSDGMKYTYASLVVQLLPDDERRIMCRDTWGAAVRSDLPPLLARFYLSQWNDLCFTELTIEQRSAALAGAQAEWDAMRLGDAGDAGRTFLFNLLIMASNANRDLHHLFPGDAFSDCAIEPVARCIIDAALAADAASESYDVLATAGGVYQFALLEGSSGQIERAHAQYVAAIRQHVQEFESEETMAHLSIETDFVAPFLAHVHTLVEDWDGAGSFLRDNPVSEPEQLARRIDVVISMARHYRDNGEREYALELLVEFAPVRQFPGLLSAPEREAGLGTSDSIELALLLHDLGTTDLAREVLELGEWDVSNFDALVSLGQAYLMIGDQALGDQSFRRAQVSDMAGTDDGPTIGAAIAVSRIPSGDDHLGPMPGYLDHQAHADWRVAAYIPY